MQKLNISKFNYHLKNARRDSKSYKILTDACIPFIKNYVIYEFGYKRSASFIETVPYDVITRILFDCPPNNLILYPESYLRKVTKNFILSQYSLKDNQTLELKEEYAYVHDYEIDLEFSSERMERVWDELDKLSQYIFMMNELNGWSLKELSTKLDIDYGYLRSKKSRAKALLEESYENKNSEEVLK